MWPCRLQPLRGGIVSESLVQPLATEGINVPTKVAQKGIESYCIAYGCWKYIRKQRKIRGDCGN